MEHLAVIGECNTGIPSLGSTVTYINRDCSLCK